ncbi:hypothetical protein JCM1841_003243 [Sporobolomyces salmonicolor]
MVPPISLVSAVSTLLGWSALLSLPASTHALVLPQNGSSTTGGRKTGKGAGDAEGWCTPRFSGLVQGIRSSAHQEIVWKAVATADKAVNDGVRAVNVGRSKSAGLELELEWFVEAGGKGGLFSIISGTAPSTCHSGGAFAPDALAQHAFAPASSLGSDCPSPHFFRILCASCDPHEDSASGCLVQSVSRGSCVELGDDNRLKWGECADLMDGSKRGWKGSAERDQRRQRQSWDISP